MPRVEFTTDGREITDYAVVLLLEVEEATETIRVYDGAHGHNEMHRYARGKGKQPGTPMGKAMSTDSNRSPAAKVMDEAINLATEGRSPYPEKAAFIDTTRLKRATRFSAPLTKAARSSSSPPTAAAGFSGPISQFISSTSLGVHLADASSMIGRRSRRF